MNMPYSAPPYNDTKLREEIKELKNEIKKWERRALFFSIISFFVGIAITILLKG
jgi:hypothetical protein